MGRCEHRRDGLALRAVARLIHGDEAFAPKIGWDVADGYAAEGSRRREHRMIGLDLHDVVVSCHRPVWPEHAVLAVVHWVFLAQPVEIRPERIGAKQFGIAGIELLKRYRIGALARRLLVDILSAIDRPVHRGTP